MAETLAPLLLAHVLADFVFQSNWMVANKHRLTGLLAHGAVVLGTLVLCLGTPAPALVYLAALHLAIDLAKTGAGRRGLWPFALDQAAHLTSLAALAGLEPDLFARGLWAGIAPLPGLMALAAGFIAATRAGGYVIAMVMQPWESEAPEGLPGGGRLIGLLERAMIFLLILTGQAAGIGFLIAAKSVLRFSDTKDDRRVSEYVIIGTLASFLWAIAMSEATRIGLSALPPLGISLPTP